MSSIKGTIKEINWVTSWQYDCLNHDCPICRSSIELNTNHICIGSCGHAFHTNCLHNWFRQNIMTKNCPICNKKWINKHLTESSIGYGYGYS